MKKIVPFNNVLQFNTDVKEITAISLEHEIKKYPDMISGVFYISGEYKITEGLLDREKFNFELPFDIALSNNYELDSLLVDIDDFRYDLISDKNLKVNIDLYIDGNEIEKPTKINDYQEQLDRNEEEDTHVEQETPCEDQTEDISLNEKISEEVEITPKEIIEGIEPERIDLLKDMLTDNKENTMSDNSKININNNNENETENINNNNENETENINNNLFVPNQEEEKYVTYRVYKVLDTDTLDSILTKYNITKEMLADYNNIENINTGDKLIIPTNEK